MDTASRKLPILPVEHLSFEYVSSCTKKGELEQIVRVLRSGEEGHYPDLLRCAEEKLRTVAGNVSLLSTPSDMPSKGSIPEALWQELKESLQDWEDEMKMSDNGLRNNPYLQSGPIPPIRVVKSPKAEPKKVDAISGASERIPSGDYQKWDKFDVDEALMKMEVEENRVLEKQEINKRKIEKQCAEPLNICHIDNKEAITEESRKILSDRAREKGNEYFKSGDLNLALDFYNESFEVLPNSLACNNRAMTYIKLGKFTEAVRDCDYVLREDASNVKALLRRATSYRSLPKEEDWKKALNDLERVISIEPNNKSAQTDYQQLRKKLKLPDNTSKVRLRIEEAPRGPLPLTFYGPSTSNFRCDPYSSTHRWLVGSSTNGPVPCKCNRTLNKQNPLCPNCGERVIKDLLKKRQLPYLEGNAANNRLNHDRNKCDFPRKSTYIVPQNSETSNASFSKPKVIEKSVESVEVRNNNGSLDAKAIVGSRITNGKDGRPTSPAKSSLVNGSALPPPSPVLNSVNLEDSRSPSMPAHKNRHEHSDIHKNPGEREDPNCKTRTLALQAKERGLSCSKIGDYSKAIAYYTTSVKLWPDLSTLICRASAYMRNDLKMEAIADWTQILQKEPENVEALLGRATALSTLSAANYWLMAMDDLKKIYQNPKSVDTRLIASVESLMKTLKEKCETKINNSKNEGSHPVGLSNGTASPSSKNPTKNRSKKKKNGKKRREHDADSHKNASSNSDPVSDLIVPVESIVLNEPPSKMNGSGDCKNNQEVNGNSLSNQAASSFSTGFQFYTQWELSRKFDPKFEKRLSLLQLVPPAALIAVIGEKLDGLMLSELLHCLKQMSLTDPVKAASFLEILPKIQRFNVVKLFLDSEDDQSLKEVFRTLDEKGVAISESIKSEFS